MFFIVKIPKIFVTIPNQGSQQFFREYEIGIASGIPRNFEIPFEKPYLP
jgi:hypothetical protein